MGAKTKLRKPSRAQNKFRFTVLRNHDLSQHNGVHISEKPLHLPTKPVTAHLEPSRRENPSDDCPRLSEVVEQLTTSRWEITPHTKVPTETVNGVLEHYLPDRLTFTEERGAGKGVGEVKDHFPRQGVGTDDRLFSNWTAALNNI